MPSKFNKLYNETSPYLLQHSENPVDWHPWTEQSLKKARTLGKPILLSIGYSACHWCHVMAHESFEDDDIANVMNEHFFNIKVDREERPDIDQIYQIAHQIIAQRPGGWPLTMFLDPKNNQPFFSGTYFPNEPRHGMPGFSDLLIRISSYFKNEQTNIENQSKKLNEIYRKIQPQGLSENEEINAEPIKTAREMIERNFDKEYGGIGGAPKFPQPASLEWLLRYWRNTAFKKEPDIEALYLCTLTLKNMAEGGLYDQVGGGFFRYCVDRHWQIPHFEKMLYDNGLLLSLYAKAYLATGDSLFKRIIEETVIWLHSEMHSGSGGFYSSINADSENKEGKFYIWERNEIKEIIDTEDFNIIEKYYGLDEEANFENKWHLTVSSDTENIAKDSKYENEKLENIVKKCNEVLLRERSLRTPPSLDKKQLVSWNALVIKGLAVSGRVLERKDYIQLAKESLEFIEQNQFNKNILMACYINEMSKFPAYLDDHAFLLDAILEFLQSEWDTKLLHFAIKLADNLIDNFLDEEKGGFFFTRNNHEKLIFRSKPMSDDAMPSGNGIACFTLQRLGFLVGDQRYLSASKKTLESGFSLLKESPHGHLNLLNALEEYLDPPESIIIVGEKNKISEWPKSTNKIFSPKRMVFSIPNNEKDLPESLAIKRSNEGKPTAYICKGHSCSKPIEKFEDLIKKITESS
tara:strand:+ start:1330 stop:3402 length:2073 start_codon:yes stop_codon:yes gene_type:complete